MHRFEWESSQGHAESHAGRFTSPQRPGVFEPWLAFVVTALVFAHAVLWGTWNTTLDWVDIAGEGFLLVILLAVYVRTAHSMLAPSAACLNWSAAWALLPENARMVLAQRARLLARVLRR